MLIAFFKFKINQVNLLFYFSDENITFINKKHR